VLLASAKTLVAEGVADWLAAIGMDPVSRGKPVPPERPTIRLWELLTSEEQRLMASLMGNAIAAEPLPRRVQLECLSAIERLMRLPPGRIAQWPEELIRMTEREPDA